MLKRATIYNKCFFLLILSFFIHWHSQYYVLANASNESVDKKNCGSCERITSESIQLENELEKTKLLLDKNNEYLKRLTFSDLTKSIKVKSNLYFISKKINLLESTLSGQKKEMERLECQICKR